MLEQVFPCHVAFVCKNKDLFGILSCVLSNVAKLPILIKNHFSDRIKFVCGPDPARRLFGQSLGLATSMSRLSLEDFGRDSSSDKRPRFHELLLVLVRIVCKTTNICSNICSEFLVGFDA